MRLVRRACSDLLPVSLLAALAAGCTTGPDGGRLDGRFILPDSDRKNPPTEFSAPAHAAWCSSAIRLEVNGVHEDLGIGLVLYPQDSLTEGSYPAFDPGVDSNIRPGSAGAVRWFDEQNIFGMQSDSGGVELSRRGERFELRFGFRLRSLDGSDTIRILGKAADLSLGRCPPDSLTPTPPRQ